MNNAFVCTISLNLVWFSIQGFGAVNGVRSDYHGCYKDTHKRDVQHSYLRSWQMTVETCKTHCQEAGYQYAALQYYHQCRCGESYGQFGAADDDGECNTRCDGNHEQMCGRSEEHTSELSHTVISYAVFCLKKKKTTTKKTITMMMMISVVIRSL